MSRSNKATDSKKQSSTNSGSLKKKEWITPRIIQMTKGEGVDTGQFQGGIEGNPSLIFSVHGSYACGATIAGRVFAKGGMPSHTKLGGTAYAATTNGNGHLHNQAGSSGCS